MTSLVHPQLLHTLASTKNEAPAIAAEKYKWDKYRGSFILDNKPDRQFVAFAIETYGTLGKAARELIEWLGRTGFPLTEVGDKVTDVDGQFGAFISRAYARISVANAVGHAQRLERRLRPPNLDLVACHNFYTDVHQSGRLGESDLSYIWVPIMRQCGSHAPNGC